MGYTLDMELTVLIISLILTLGINKLMSFYDRDFLQTYFYDPIKESSKTTPRLAKLLKVVDFVISVPLFVMPFTLIFFAIWNFVDYSNSQASFSMTFNMSIGMFFAACLLLGARYFIIGLYKTAIGYFMRKANTENYQDLYKK
jgi:hypothetical protein